MSPATWPREDPLGERLLVVDPTARDFHDAFVRDLPRYLRRGDLLVVNDAATLPASLFGKTSDGAPVEVRLASRRGDVWTAVLFGPGDWHSKTEDRALPPPLSRGDRIVFDPGLSAVVARAHSRRVADLEFSESGALLVRSLYRVGRPIQYAYLSAALPLWAVQTSYASRPWAFEMPSAGRPLTWSLLRDLEQRGVALARLTHAAGLSSTGDAVLDAELPFPEVSDIPAATVEAVVNARACGGRVVAVGTSVVRALEGRIAKSGELTPGEAETDLRIEPGFCRRVVDGLFTGMHEPTASHYALLGGFAPSSLLGSAYEHAATAGYLHHEFGDSNLILDDATSTRTNPGRN